MPSNFASMHDQTGGCHAHILASVRVAASSRYLRINFGSRTGFETHGFRSCRAPGGCASFGAHYRQVTGGSEVVCDKVLHSSQPARVLQALRPS